MHITPDGKIQRTDIWREGNWLDLWSIVHLLSGTLVGIGFYFLGFGALASTALALVSLTAYEMWEMLVRIEETPTNRLMDVVVGMAGFVPAFFLFAPALSPLRLIVVFGTVFAIDITMSTFGWRASQKAAAFKERMRARYGAERLRLRKRRVHLLERFRRGRKQSAGDYRGL